MKTELNQHGEKVTAVCTHTDGRGGRITIKIVEFVANGRKLFAVQGITVADAASFAVQVKRLKKMLSDESCKTEWLI